MLEVLIVGVGYVGLVTGVCFANMGYHVTCLDINAQKVGILQQGKSPIYEPGLEELLRQGIEQGRLRFTTDYKEAVERSQICFLAVDTPQANDGSCNLGALKEATRSIATHMNGYKVIVTKSTVPVGTFQLVKEIVRDELERRGACISFDIVCSPEFLKEGSAIADCMKPDRIVIGVETERARRLMYTLYRPFMQSHDRMIFMSPESAELTKYAANTMLALRICFMNWLSQFCEKTGADIGEVRKGIGSDSRIGYDFLWAGAGFGGSCFPKDVAALGAMMRKEAVSAVLVDAIQEINHSQKRVLFEKMQTYFGDKGGLGDKTIAVFGLSFKPDTDDMREAPSLTLIADLLAAGTRLRLYDPAAMENARKLLLADPNIVWCGSAMEAALGADAIALVTEWKQFRLLDFQALLQSMRGKAFFDGRNQYTPADMARRGFDYLSIGRQPAFSCTEDVPSDAFIAHPFYELLPDPQH